MLICSKNTTLSIVFSLILFIVVTALSPAFSDIKVYAKSIATSVTVGNSPPAFSVNASDNSSSTTPTNIGTSVTFTATAADSNNENYYLAICKTNSVTPVNGSSPTCAGGNWCISSSTVSGVSASCSYLASDSDVEVNDWYAFVCDGNSSSASCSVASSAGTNPSPFDVNHPPTFSAIGVTTPAVPGATVSWTTGIGTSDRDSQNSDTVKLVVCKTAGVVAGDCDGGASDRWCQSTAVNSNPSCSYFVPIPTADAPYNAYVYVFDNHNLVNVGAVTAGSSSNYTISNIAPELSSLTINSGAAISLAAGQTTPVVASATVVDNNGCSDLSSVVASIYRSSVTFASCDTAGDADDNSCYPVITCATSNCSTGASATYSCTAYLEHFADPTTASTPHESDTWLDNITVTDNNSATDTEQVSSGVELNTLLAYDFTDSIAYGNLSVGQKNDPLDKVTLAYSQGNTGIDQDLRGTDMTNGGSGTIPVGQQHYSLTPSTAYSVGTTLTTADITSLIHVPKPSNSVGTSLPTYWGLEIPANIPAGTYTGTNEFTARVSNAANW